MDQALRLILPIYFVLYFGFAFVAKSMIVAKKIGKSPLVLPNDDTAFGLVGRYFKLTLIAMFVYVLLYVANPNTFGKGLNIMQLENTWVDITGIFLLGIALILTVVAQYDMRDSWRIGIDTETETELITTGLFKYSRNPVFLGMVICLLGLFLVTPNALTLLFLILGYVLIQIQIRLEEAFLTKQHGLDYISYQKKVRRFL